MNSEFLSDTYQFLKKSKFGRAVIGAVVISGLIFTVWSSLPDEIQTRILSAIVSPTTSSDLEPSVPNRPPKPPLKIQKSRLAPIVTFIDNKQASVAFSVTTHIEDSDAAVVVYSSGSAEAALNSVDSRIKSAVIAEMEKRTISEARQNRLEIEALLKLRLEAEFKKLGITLDSISLTEIDEL